jgi:2-amino-4-hydroxy-6-hydroxymethyldihydropteridine diphosphokinase
VYLGVGTNLGDRVAHLRYAIARMGEVLEITGISAVYETRPVGYVDQPAFLNLVIRARCTLEPAELLAQAKRIERERGRERTFRNAPRTLDIDILLYGETRLDEPGLTIPHPRMAERGFVLRPLLELAPDLKEPGTGRPYRDHLTRATPGGDRVLSDSELVAGGASPDRGEGSG